MGNIIVALTLCARLFALCAVEQPTKFELVTTLIAAKQIGVTIPPHVGR